MILDFSQDKIKAIFEICEDESVILKHFSVFDEDSERQKLPAKRKIVNIQVSGETRVARVITPLNTFRTNTMKTQTAKSLR